MKAPTIRKILHMHSNGYSIQEIQAQYPFCTTEEIASVIMNGTGHAKLH